MAMQLATCTLPLPAPLGIAFAAFSPKGLAALLLGDALPALQTQLQSRFPAASLLAPDTALQARLRQHLAALPYLHLPARSSGAPLALDVQGTAFQLRVWQALQGIPAGQPTSYSQLAQAIGQPTAVRAVASACGANPLALLIPCHRVVQKSGQLGGYRWGLQRKAALLAWEAASHSHAHEAP